MNEKQSCSGVRSPKQRKEKSPVRRGEGSSKVENGKRSKSKVGELTQERLKYLLQYDPKTGNMIRKFKMAWLEAGSIVGTKTHDGIYGSVEGKRWSMHRLVWFYFNGVVPTEEIVHINGNNLDNRIENLKERVNRDFSILLTQDRLQELFEYNPKTGIFIRRIGVGPTKKGSIAGTPMNMGYLLIRVDGTLYLAHRLAWFYIHGKWPDNQIDHRDHNRKNNRLSNLREATNSQNCCNKVKAQANNKCGYLGVCFNKLMGFWQSSIQLNGKGIHLGYFNTPEEAHLAYVKAKRKVHSHNIL